MESRAMVVDAGVSRRERKKQQTRAAIVAAALNLALEQGPDGTTIDQICELADVSRRTFSNYFASKEDAMVNWDPDRSRILRSLFEARPVDEHPLLSLAAAYAEMATREKASELWRASMQLVRTYPSLAARWAAATASVEDELTEAVAERMGVDPARNMYPTVLVAAGVAAARATARAHWEDERGRSLSALIQETFAFLTAGMPVEPPARTRRGARRRTAAGAT